MSWNKQSENNLFDISVGSTVLIKFKSDRNGITMDNDQTVDISWIRTGKTIHATSGNYVSEDIIEWQLID